MRRGLALTLTVAMLGSLLAGLEFAGGTGRIFDAFRRNAGRMEVLEL